nr:T-cell surface glycoprotein CD8 alpha chain-like [Nerophis lumbriciformis]
MDQQWICILAMLLFNNKLTAGSKHMCKEGQKVEIHCKPSEVGSMIMWFRALDNSGMEFLASFSNNGMQKSHSDSFSSTFNDLKIRDDILVLQAFTKARDSGVYGCATLKNNELKFGKVTRLTGDKVEALPKVTVRPVKLNPSTTTLPCVCEISTQDGSMLCNPIILIPLAGSCGLLLLLIAIIVVYCNRVRTRRCPHHYKRKLRNKVPLGKQQQQQK